MVYIYKILEIKLDLFEIYNEKSQILEMINIVPYEHDTLEVVEEIDDKVSKRVHVNIIIDNVKKQQGYPVILVSSIEIN